MTTFVLVHGAFRGGWAWDKVRDELVLLGHTVIAPTLTGCEPDTLRVGTRVGLAEWVQDIRQAMSTATADSEIVLVAHSQAGIPVRQVLETDSGKIKRVVYLDAAVPGNGQRGVDLNPPGVPAPPADLDPTLMIPARPVGPEQGFVDPELIEFVNSRLVPTPIGPSLDAVTLRSTDAHKVPATFAFFSQTPQTYPCQYTRLHLDDQGISYAVLDGPHDSPMVNAHMVCEFLLSS